MNTAICALAAFSSSVVAVRYFLGVSRRRFIDHPGTRSSHVRPTPTGGGFPAVIIWLLVAACATGAGFVAGGPRWWAAALCSVVLGALGLADDARDLPRWIRYSVHLLVGCAIVYLVGHVDSPSSVPWILRAAATAIAVTVLINAFNFMDGIDALVGGCGILILGFVAAITGDDLWLIAAAAYGGFLVFNLPPARIFMGDAGSTTLGGLVAVALLSGRDRLEPGHLLVMAPLVGDSAYTIVRRMLRRENIFRSHHSHLYQRLFRAGHSHAAVTAGYVAATLAIAAMVTLGGPVGQIASAAAGPIAIVFIEAHLTARRVPFTRPAPSNDIHGEPCA